MFCLQLDHTSWIWRTKNSDENVMWTILWKTCRSLAMASENQCSSRKSAVQECTKNQQQFSIHVSPRNFHLLFLNGFNEFLQLFMCISNTFFFSRIVISPMDVCNINHCNSYPICCCVCFKIFTLVPVTQSLEYAFTRRISSSSSISVKFFTMKVNSEDIFVRTAFPICLLLFLHCFLWSLQLKWQVLP